MSESEANFGFEDKSLSLIDVSFEDDCLYNSPPRDYRTPHLSDKQTENKNVQLLDVQDGEESLEDDKQVIQPLESTEQEKMRKNEKYNLRNSLAWDSAFFTSAGVLEPEEISNMIEGTEKVGKVHVLPGIEEDVRRSIDSISTLVTDISTIETLEDDLFGDIRASIQKSSKAANAAISHCKAGSRVNDGQLIKSSERVTIVTQNKLKTKKSPKKPNVIIKGSGKMANQVSPNPQAPKSGSINGESTSSLCKPPKIAGRVGPILTTAGKRASLGANHAKMEKDNAKNSNSRADNPKKLAGRGSKLPTMGGSRNAVPNPKPPLKSSLRSSLASKKELTTSSSADSSGSLSSDSSSKHSFNTVKRKIDPKPGNHLSNISTIKTTLTNKNQSISRHISPYMKSVTKLSSSISPSSSISEWSLESFSPTSSLNRRSNSSRPSIDISSCENASDNGDFPQVLDSQIHSSDKCSVKQGTQVTRLSSEHVKRVPIRSGALADSESTKPSGLRLPSPKIGFFDGARSAVRSPSGLARNGTANGTSVASNEAKLGKLQPARTVVAARGTKTGLQPAPGNKGKPPFPLQETSNAAPKVCSVSRNGKCSPGMPPKLQNRMSPGNGGKSSLKADKISPKECHTSVNNQPINYGERNGSLDKDKMSPQNESNGSIKVAGLGAIHDLSSLSGDENIILQKVAENAIDDQKNNLYSPLVANEKEQTYFGDAVGDMALQLEAVDIYKEIQQKPVLDYSSFNHVNESREVDTSPPRDSAKLFRPAPALNHTEGVALEIDES
ncbi:uncharacterized protein LOC105642173 isoform X2 [Jatropha curcas]|uniref:uncharacterized protein LOC105642173 isoform X2 n=1 Tax=Jatropha curcas TaxID=180498 RepID=UPI0005FAF3B9|nr:uncharacterized protein LOC105642173 isoform X2 [Jatropha curcas]